MSVPSNAELAARARRLDPVMVLHNWLSRHVRPLTEGMRPSWYDWAARNLLADPEVAVHLTPTSTESGRPRFFTVFDYDFNDPHGRVVISRALFAERDFIGQQVVLATVEGDRREGDEFDGFGCIVTVTGVQDPIHSPDHVALLTDYYERQYRQPKET